MTITVLWSATISAVLKDSHTYDSTKKCSYNTFANKLHFIVDKFLVLC